MAATSPHSDNAKQVLEGDASERGPTALKRTFDILRRLCVFALRAMRSTEGMAEPSEVALARERGLAAEERVKVLASTNAALTAALTKIADVPVGRAPELLLVEVARAAGADVCYWFEHDSRANTLAVTLRVQNGRLLEGPASDEPEIFGGPFPSDLTPAVAILRTQKAFTTVCSRSEAQLMWPGAMDWHRRHGRKEALAFAVQVGDEVLGLVGMAFVDERVMDDLLKQQLVRALASQFALAWRLSRLAKEAERVAVVQARSAELEIANAAIRATVTRLAEEPSLDSFLGLMLMELARAIGTGTAVLTQYSPKTDTIHIAAMVHNGQIIPLERMPVRVAVSEFAAWPIICQAKSIVVFDVERDRDLFWPGAIERLRTLGAQACAAIPIRSGQTTMGQMSFAYPHAPKFNEVQEAMIEVFCHQAALALQLTDLASRANAEAAARAVSEERNRMAGEIHDSLAQSFTSIALQSESLISKLDERSSLRTTLETIEETARLGLAQARRSVLALRPIGDELGELQSALAQLAGRCNISGSVVCEFRTSTDPCALSADVRDAVLRVAQEAVNNALRHARARRIFIEFDVHGGEATLTVSDDGVGIAEVSSMRPGGFGIPGMRARAQSLGGTLTLSPVTGALGTAVRLRVACQAKRAGST